MDKKKTVYVRVRKIAPKRFLIEQRRKFMFFWEFWQKGCPTLRLKKYYSSKQTARTAIYANAEKHDIRPVVFII